MSSTHPPTNSQSPSFELTMDQGPQPGQDFTLTKSVSTIGRASGNDIVVDIQDVSRNHARITWDGNQLVIEDLGSANGTFVNGVRLTGPQVLGEGDSLGLADTVSFAVRATGPIPVTTPGVDQTLVSAHSAQPPPPVSPRPRGKGKGCIWISALVLVGLFAVLAVAAAAGYFYFRQRSDVTRPAVSITSPQMGTQVEVGQPVAVDSITHDKKKIVRVELWVDGELQKVKNSTLPDGMSPFPMSADWRPNAIGTHTLVVRAFNRKGERGQAAVSVETTERADRDDDGVPDEEDACPDEPGSVTAAGCPDRDLDGIPDAEDACPDEPGPQETDGCPAPRENDRDGDGVPDDIDACPDELGSAWTGGCPDRDGDEIRDSEDACPDEWGVPEYGGCPPPDDRDGDGVLDEVDVCPDEWGLPDADGCPDRDGDGVRDLDDACPDEWGLPELEGCPDRDMDGIRDLDDACPDAPGPPERHGCPDTGAGDRDDDGVPDDADVSPDEPGDPEDGGAPGPGEGEDADDDGIPDDEEPPGGPFDDIEPPGGFLGDVFIHVPVEFQALELEVDDDYDEVYAYAGLAGADMERFGPFDPLGERRWDIAEYLGGASSVHLAVPLGEPLQVQAAGGAQDIFMGEDGGWGTYYDLGEFIREHPSSDWDGHVITVRSEGDDGHWFQAKYRICQDTCESSTFPPPVLILLDLPDGKHLFWLWGGDEEDIDGFKIYKDGNVAIAPIPSDVQMQNIRFFEPPCGRGLSFYVTAFGGDRESPPSNTVYWSGPPCPRTVQVTFDKLFTGDLMRGRRHGSEPIEGKFWVVGSEGRQELPFESHDIRLNANSDHSIQEIFNDIIRRWDSCLGRGCPDREAPESSSVSVELGPGDDLTFGGKIEDRDGMLFEGEETLAAGHIAPGEYNIHNRLITLRVLVDVLVGPEAGDGRLPDLIITDVTDAGSGRLAIHVFNNAADLDDADIEINLVQMSTNTSLGIPTWERVTIPSGGEEVLTTDDLGLEPYDLRLIIDPDNRIEEAGEGERNNVYETPVVMRVEFLSVFAPNCAENSCSIFDCDSEFVFSLWAGHGPSRSEVEWVAHNARFPRTGELVQCGHDICRGSESPAEDWHMEGDERYTFEFEMPASDSLFVMTGGKEIDHLSNDDTLGYISHSYDRYNNWGGSSDSYRDSSGEEAVICDDTFCTRCPDGFVASWRITRVH